MKKMLFLMLFLLILGAANVNSQVRIGGNGTPHGAAVLDLNANNDATPAGNKGALALPRVSLSSNTAPLNGTNPITGMLVYNTGGTLGAGIYYWDGSKWLTVGNTTPTYTGSTSITLSGNSFSRAALSGAVIADANSNETRIANGAIDSAQIAAKSIGLSHLKITDYILNLPAMKAGAAIDTVWSALPESPIQRCVIAALSTESIITIWSINSKQVRVRNMGGDNKAGTQLYAKCFAN